MTTYLYIYRPLALCAAWGPWAGLKPNGESLCLLKGHWSWRCLPIGEEQRAFLNFHLCVSPIVYQLQQEAPRPKRMTCPQEVGTSVNLWTMGPLLCDDVALTKPVNPCQHRSSWVFYLTNWWVLWVLFKIHP